MIDSIYKKDGNYYPKVFLEIYNFNDDIEIYADEENSDDSDDSDKKIEMNKILMKKIKCIDLNLEKTSKLISSLPEMWEDPF